MQFQEFAQNYSLARDIARRTAAEYRFIGRQFDRWLVDSGHKSDLESLSATALNRYLSWMIENGRSRATTHAHRNKILVLWRSAYLHGHTANRPDTDRVRPVKVPNPNPIVFTPDEMRTLVAWCEENMRHRLFVVPVPAGDYLAALFLFLWDSGMRLGDALSMRFEWIAPTITFRQSKTGTWHRANLTKRTRDAIERIRHPPRSMIWPRSESNRTALYRLISAAVKGAGLRGTSKYIRRGVATDVFKRGLDPGRALGHVPGSRVAIRFYVPPEEQIDPVSPTEL